MTFTMDDAAVCLALAIAFGLWDVVDIIWWKVQRDHQQMLWADLYRYACRRCGALLGLQSTAHGVEHWRCPVCGEPHWWRS